jgi:hypothetical protein
VGTACLRSIRRFPEPFVRYWRADVWKIADLRMVRAGPVVGGVVNDVVI